MLSEVQTYLERLRAAREEILHTLDGLDNDALNWKPLPDETNSLIVLAIHSLGAERQWLHELVGHVKIDRDRPAEFRARAENVDSLNTMYAAAALTTENLLGALTEADMDAERSARKKSRTVRWCILHTLEHYNEHLGQMRLTRQLWENRHTRPHEI